MPPTKLDKSTITNLGDKSDAKKIEEGVGKVDTTLGSVERIAGKVENIMTMLTKFKILGNKESVSPETSIAPKIEAGVQKGIGEKVEAIKKDAKIKVKTEQLVLQLKALLDNLDAEKTVGDMKKEIEKAEKFGLINKIVEDFVLNNCEVEYG